MFINETHIILKHPTEYNISYLRSSYRLNSTLETKQHTAQLAIVCLSNLAICGDLEIFALVLCTLNFTRMLLRTGESWSYYYNATYSLNVREFGQVGPTLIRDASALVRLSVFLLMDSNFKRTCM